MLTCAFVGRIALHKPAATSEEMENKVFTGAYSISLRPFYLANGMGRLCMHQEGSKSSAKRETLFEINDINPPSTAVPSMFLRELRGEVPEKVGQVEDAYRAKDNLCFEPSRGHSKPASHQLLRRSSFVQKNWGVDLLRPPT